LEEQTYLLVLREHWKILAIVGELGLNNLQFIDISQRKQNLDLRIPNLLEIKYYHHQPHSTPSNSQPYRPLGTAD